mmetsp:Transcript_2162/g.7273  ORF Transcript_2162/g.7273 Transcript_2162/m.7273 type:complete len:216 (+) Transcript_2162:591-1238(+)
MELADFAWVSTRGDLLELSLSLRRERGVFVNSRRFWPAAPPGRSRGRASQSRASSTRPRGPRLFESGNSTRGRWPPRSGRSRRRELDRNIIRRWAVTLFDAIAGFAVIRIANSTPGRLPTRPGPFRMRAWELTHSSKRCLRTGGAAADGSTRSGLRPSRSLWTSSTRTTPGNPPRERFRQRPRRDSPLPHPRQARPRRPTTSRASTSPVRSCSKN